MAQMEGEAAKQNFDQALLRFLDSADETESNRLLEQLVCECAQPLVNEIVNFKLRVYPTRARTTSEQQDAEDVSGDVILRLVKRLRELKTNPQDKPIKNLRSYVAVMSYHACDEYLRHKYPQRHSLKNKLRYVLTHSRKLALWEADDKWLCGLVEWRDKTKPIAQAGKLQDNLQEFTPYRDAQNSNPADLLAAIFNRAGSPVELDSLVTIVADLWGIQDKSAQAADNRNSSGAHESFYDPRGSADTAPDQRASLERLWAEICELPVKQRVALLLNLRDEQGRGVITLLPLIRIASIRKLAETLAMPPEQLAALWEDLPLDDQTIAKHLSVTRQQVINLRKSARERLARRTKAFNKGA